VAAGLVFVGLVGMIDPLREEARAAIETCRLAGIRTVMITGDQEATADRDRSPARPGPRSLQGRPLRTAHDRELAGLDAAGWQALAARWGCSRASRPEHKLRIVEALQASGEVVAMTGDGVNDAPALKQADIGVAMGIKGTDVAKEAAAMVITDDNFATIVRAVEQGRVIYANILRFVHYLFSCNLAEILVVFTALMLGWPLPLAALQILWLNMITDVFPAMALALEPSNPDAMKRPPRDPREPLVTPRFVWLIGWQGALLAAVTLLAFLIGHALVRRRGPRPAARDHDGVHDPRAGPGVPHLQRPLAAPARRSPRSCSRTAGCGRRSRCACSSRSPPSIRPFLQTVLHTTPLTAADWGVVLGLSVFPIGVVELVKLLRRAPA
jgi:Ca2+-transporting ATPase